MTLISKICAALLIADAGIVHAAQPAYPTRPVRLLVGFPPCSATGWEPNSVEMGFAAGDDTVTIARTGGIALASVAGATPEEMMPYIADAVVRQNSWQLMFTVGMASRTLRPLVLLSPILAETIAKAGWTKRDVKQNLFDHARISAQIGLRISGHDRRDSA